MPPVHSAPIMPASSPSFFCGTFSRINALDCRALSWLALHRSSRFTFALRALCRFYNTDSVVVILMLLSVASQSTFQVGFQLNIILSVVSGVVFVVKRKAKRVRPHMEVQALAPPDAYSFPSGHTANAFALAISMFALVPPLGPLFLALAVVIGFARMYLGLHYPVDVLVGTAIGSGIGGLFLLYPLAQWVPN